MKRKPKSAIKKKTEKLWGLVKKVVYLRDKSMCQHCHKEVSGHNRHPNHVIPQSHGNILKYDIENIITMCFHCHMNWWHKNPLEAALWFEAAFNIRYKYLIRKKEMYLKITESWLDEQIEEMEIMHDRFIT